jgi:hypothetical protein
VPTTHRTGGFAVSPQVPVSSPPRFGEGPVTTALNLGPLASLAGSWRGNGFNAIWRPDNPESEPFTQIKRYLELNLTSESIDFHVIPGVVPNRGLGPQEDLHLYGLHYLQRVSDADVPPVTTAGQALHIEPGLFMSVPESEHVKEDTIVRLASIPHGVSVLMQGKNPGTQPTAGEPEIPPIFPIANLPHFNPVSPEGHGIQPVEIPAPAGKGEEHNVPENLDTAADGPGSQSNGPFPADFQGFVNDPNVVLRNAIANQTILGFIAIELSTENVDSSIGNIPFLGIPNIGQEPGVPAQASNPLNANAFVYSAAATFWIEWVAFDTPNAAKHGGPSGLAAGAADGASKAIEPFAGKPNYLQLQYSQVVILIFNKVLWPHVTVATLTLSAG